MKQETKNTFTQISLEQRFLIRDRLRHCVPLSRIAKELNLVACGSHIVHCVRRVACREHRCFAHLSCKGGHLLQFLAGSTRNGSGVCHTLLKLRASLHGLLCKQNKGHCNLHSKRGAYRSKAVAQFRQSSLRRLQAFTKSRNIRADLDHKISNYCHNLTSLLFF